MKAAAVALAAIALVVLVSTPAFAEQGADPPSCMSLDKAQALVAAVTISWATPEEWNFLRGIYVMNPATPPGLPPGDGALILRKGGEGDGVILWSMGGGALVCSPMPAAAKLLAILAAVRAGAAGVPL